ncbi:MAG: hypothetical protein EZS28_047438, partial [Streblomastix strix]
GFDGRTINCFTHHTPDSKMNNRFYVSAVNKEGLDKIHPIIEIQGN